MLKFIAGAIVGYFACMVVGEARAQSLCLPRDQILAQITGPKYGERQIGVGIINEKTVLEIFVSPTSGSWTMLTTDISGISCLAGSGQNWEPRPADKGKAS